MASKKSAGKQRKSTTRKRVTRTTMDDVLRSDRIASILEEVNEQRFEIKTMILAFYNEKDLKVYSVGNNIELLGLSEVLRYKLSEFLDE